MIRIAGEADPDAPGSACQVCVGRKDSADWCEGHAIRYHRGGYCGHSYDDRGYEI